MESVHELVDRFFKLRGEVGRRVEVEDGINLAEAASELDRIAESADEKGNKPGTRLAAAARETAAVVRLLLSDSNGAEED